MSTEVTHLPSGVFWLVRRPLSEWQHLEEFSGRELQTTHDHDDGFSLAPVRSMRSGSCGRCGASTLAISLELHSQASIGAGVLSVFGQLSASISLKMFKVLKTRWSLNYNRTYILSFPGSASVGHKLVSISKPSKIVAHGCIRTGSKKQGVSQTGPLAPAAEKTQKGTGWHSNHCVG